MTSGYRASRCESNPSGNSTQAPRYISVPQNLESRSDFIRTYFTYLLSCFAKSSTGGISWSSTSAVALDLEIVMLMGREYRLPGFRAYDCPSHLSGGSLTVWPSLRWNVW